MIHERSRWRPWRCTCGGRYDPIHLAAQEAARVIEAERAAQAEARLIVEIQNIPADEARRRWEREVREANGFRNEQRIRRGVR